MAIPLRTVCALALWILVAPIGGAAVPELGQPTWAQLTPEQRKILKPLAAEWNAMEAFRRKKWLGIAERHAAMSAAEQERVQRRMREWAKLTPEERKQARDKYKTLKKVSPEQRESLRQNWEDYRALPPEERKRLNDEAVRRSPVSSIPTLPAQPKLRQKITPSTGKNAH